MNIANAVRRYNAMAMVQVSTHERRAGMAAQKPYDRMV